MKTRRKHYQVQEAQQNHVQKSTKQASQITALKVDTTPPSVNDEKREDELTEKFKQLYEDIKSSPSFSAKIEQFLRSNEVHSKFRRIVKRKFPRRRIIARFPFELFQADLIEYPKYKNQNRNFVYCLVIIDCFTKFVWTKPMKTKSGIETANAFDSTFKELDEYPINLITDAGLEFFNSHVARVFSSFNIVHYKPPTKTNWKASIAERVIQTLKRRLEKYFYKHNTKNWVHVIDQITKNYNNTPHSAHGFKPVDVSDENRDEVYNQLYPDRRLSVVCKLNVGDRVRKIREKTLFEKGYTQNWSDEIFIISSVRQSRGVCWYKLTTLDEEQLPGIWYYYQLNLVSRNVGENQREND